MLQNMLAKVITITNLYISIEENMELRNRTGVNYDVARLVRSLVIFDPIEPIDEDLSRDLLPDGDGGSNNVDPDVLGFTRDNKRDDIS